MNSILLIWVLEVYISMICTADISSGRLYLSSRFLIAQEDWNSELNTGIGTDRVCYTWGSVFELWTILLCYDIDHVQVSHTILETSKDMV